ncbi:unnamed protein product [Caenorhabditis angaria]|uniref:Divalent-cation tolerance protein CutA n=1 Tax=Caenorhabditis angaria TaxID=860376 RepID=A0A9P1IIW9_9PELO|nr:unnamed protein product [Caenorhabditis angaria]
MASNLAKLMTVLITVPTKEVGLTISRKIVEEKLAACINIIPAITSVYEWQGKLEESDELLMIVKTTNERINELEKVRH